MPWCVRCGTSLSQHELTDSYAELTHTAVYLTLPFKDRPDERALVWTTTPWTLSAHVALAVHPALDYVKVRVKVRHQDQILYLARDAAARLGLQDRVLARLKGAELLNRPYHGPFDELPVQQGVDHRVIPWDEVNATEGSGIVHIAPGCGAEDYQLGQRYGLPALTPLDDNGLYTAGYGPFTGRSVFSVAPLVFEQLEQAGCLFALEEYTHRYPRCWRCKEELVYRLVGEWFIAIDEIRPRMLNAARQIEWLPPHAGKRMEDWLHNMGDWCISRKRYWGLPLPFYQSEDGQLLVVRDKDQLRQLAKTLLEISRKIPADINWVLRVDGHTDKDPIKTARFPSNWELSSARAISVVQLLIKQGLPPNRLAAAGFGEFQPLENRSDEIGKRRNRRIELKLTQR